MTDIVARDVLSVKQRFLFKRTPFTETMLVKQIFKEIKLHICSPLNKVEISFVFSKTTLSINIVARGTINKLT